MKRFPVHPFESRMSVFGWLGGPGRWISLSRSLGTCRRAKPFGGGFWDTSFSDACSRIVHRPQPHRYHQCAPKIKTQVGNWGLQLPTTRATLHKPSTDTNPGLTHALQPNSVRTPNGCALLQNDTDMTYHILYRLYSASYFYDMLQALWYQGDPICGTAPLVALDASTRPRACFLRYVCFEAPINGILNFLTITHHNAL